MNVRPFVRACVCVFGVCVCTCRLRVNMHIKNCQKLACDHIHNNVKAPPPSCKSKHISRSSTFNVQLIELTELVSKKKKKRKKQ